MGKIIRLFIYVLGLSQVAFVHIAGAQPINRKEVVERHRVQVRTMDTLGSLTVGNGRFAYTVDATGLQSFPEYYSNGIPLGTQSEWGWNRFPNENHYRHNETLKAFDFNHTGRSALYSVQSKGSKRSEGAVEYYRSNPYRLQLGNVGMVITKNNGKAASTTDIQNIQQELDPWSGIITSTFTVDGINVHVTTVCHADLDRIAFKIVSPLLREKRLKIFFRFPYPTGQFADKGVNYSDPDKHRSFIASQSQSGAQLVHQLDSITYYVTTDWTGKAEMKESGKHEYLLTPEGGDSFSATVDFSLSNKQVVKDDFAACMKSSIAAWASFWQSGAAIDFAGSTDPRAAELERRIILSQYLLRAQEAGNYPPQETGLTYNSWYGRPHMEMLWWHTAHYALWGRAPIMEKAMQWYFKAYKGAREIAKRQGYKGVRWQKMTDNWGNESPSNVGSFLIWQQPNVIYEAELLYRDHPSKAVLQKYKELVFSTADFMASFATFDKTNNRYNLGKGIIPAQECFKPEETFNSPYELAYWKWGLEVAQKWRKKLGLAPESSWQKVIDRIAPLPVEGAFYSSAESVDDSFSPQSKFTIDHPAVLMPLSNLPANGVVDTSRMHRTFDKVEQVWHWEHTWGWDFPMVAMTATRLNLPEKAIDALFKPIETNTYLVNGHNYQNGRLTLYLPGNGSLLAAVALMCAGDDNNKIPNPGFPKNGKWKVRWEGLKHLP